MIGQNMLAICKNRRAMRMTDFRLPILNAVSAKPKTGERLTDARKVRDLVPKPARGPLRIDQSDPGLTRSQKCIGKYKPLYICAVYNVIKIYQIYI